MAVRQIPVTLEDDVRLNAVLERTDENPRPLVIVLHGLTSDMTRRHTLDACGAMRGAGFATLRVDLYGHGTSGGEFRRHTLFKWVSNVLTAVDWAGSRDFVTEIWLSGHSQGGLAAALAAGMEPDHVRGLILRAPAFMIPRGAREGELLGYRFDPLHIPDEIPAVNGLSLDGNYLRVAQTVYPEEAAARFPGPVLILHGDADDVVPCADSVEYARRFPDCSLEILPGETHHFDRDPDRMRRIIGNWLKARAPAARNE